MSGVRYREPMKWCILAIVVFLAVLFSSVGHAQLYKSVEEYGVTEFSEICVDENLITGVAVSKIKNGGFRDLDYTEYAHYYSGILPAEIRLFDISRSKNESIALSFSTGGARSDSAAKLFFDGKLGHSDKITNNVLHWPPSSSLPSGAIGQIRCSVIINDADTELVFNYLRKSEFYSGFLGEPDHSFEQSRRGHNEGQYEEFFVWLLGSERRQIGLLSVTGPQQKTFTKLSFLRYVKPNEDPLVYDVRPE